MSWACECYQGAIGIPENFTCLSQWGRTGAIRQRLARIARSRFAASGLDRTLPGPAGARHKGKANQSVASAKFERGEGLLDVRHAPIATEFCMAEKFRDVPGADIAWALETFVSPNCAFAV